MRYAPTLLVAVVAVAVCICTSASAQTPLNEIHYGNGTDWMAAARAGMEARQFKENLEIQQKNQLLNQQVGDALARHNYEEAANIAARGGNIDLYWRIKEMEKR